MMHVTEKFKHLIIPLNDIIIATDEFADKNCIGGGGFGKVYKEELVLSNTRTQTIVALKRLDRAFGQGNPEFWKEIITLSTYKHENIVSLLGFCDEGGEKILIYEYASKGSLDSYLNNNDLKWATRLKICIGVARGLAFLHDPGATHQRVLHRDIKSSNILLDENWNAKISDLGLSKFGPANQPYTFLVSNAVGTIGYCDPLYMETGLLTKESDVYSFGVVLFEVLCGRLCFDNTTSYEGGSFTGFMRRCYKEGNLSKIIHADMEDEITTLSLQQFTAIAYQCLSRDLQKRPAMTKVVSELENALQYQDDKTTRLNKVTREPFAYNKVTREPSAHCLVIKEPSAYNKDNIEPSSYKDTELWKTIERMEARKRMKERKPDISRKHAQKEALAAIQEKAAFPIMEMEWQWPLAAMPPPYYDCNDLELSPPSYDSNDLELPFPYYDSNSLKPSPPYYVSNSLQLPPPYYNSNCLQLPPPYYNSNCLQLPPPYYNSNCLKLPLPYYNSNFLKLPPPFDDNNNLKLPPPFDDNNNLKLPPPFYDSNDLEHLINRRFGGV